MLNIVLATFSTSKLILVTEGSKHAQLSRNLSVLTPDDRSDVPVKRNPRQWTMFKMIIMFIAIHCR
jgi:hypothetical protein